MGLRAAIALQRVDIAHNVLIQLVDSQISVWKQTFELMVDCGIAAQDMESVQTFIGKMEQAGHHVDDEVYAKAMDLFAAQSQEGQETMYASTPESTPTAPSREATCQAA